MAQTIMRQTDRVVTFPEGTAVLGRGAVPIQTGRPFVARCAKGMPGVAVVHHAELLLLRGDDRQSDLTVVPLSHFVGVSIRRRNASYVVALYHENPALQLDIAIATRLADALSLRSRLARQWRMEEAYITQDGTVYGLADSFGRLEAVQAHARRAGSFRRSRPRFLVKRKIGRGPQYLRIGREIIART